MEDQNWKAVIVNTSELCSDGNITITYNLTLDDEVIFSNLTCTNNPSSIKLVLIADCNAKITDYNNSKDSSLVPQVGESITI
jgi:hypothetical protein